MLGIIVDVHGWATSDDGPFIYNPETRKLEENPNRGQPVGFVHLTLHGENSWVQLDNQEFRGNSIDQIVSDMEQWGIERINRVLDLFPKERLAFKNEKT